jgi:hypothetical protein
MATSWLFRFFKVGQIPAPLRAELENEGIVLLEEGVNGSVTYKNFRSPGRISMWRRTGCVASLIITRTRVVALVNSSRFINVPFDDSRIAQLEVQLERSNTVRIGFDPSLFRDDWSGSIDFRCQTEQAQAFVNEITRQSTIKP